MLPVIHIPTTNLNISPVSIIMGGVDKNKVIGIVQFMGGRQEFMDFAKKFVVDLATYEKRQLAFADKDFAERIESCTVVILGQVKGEVINQIWFVKDEEKQ